MFLFDDSCETQVNSALHRMALSGRYKLPWSVSQQDTGALSTSLYEVWCTLITQHWLLNVHQVCLTRPPESPISLTGARWGCLNLPSSTHTLPHSSYSMSLKALIAQVAVLSVIDWKKVKCIQCLQHDHIWPFCKRPTNNLTVIIKNNNIIMGVSFLNVQRLRFAPNNPPHSHLQGRKLVCQHP